MNEYPISKAYKAIGLLFSAAFAIGGIYLLFLLATPDSNGAAQTAKLVFGIALLPLGYWVYRESLRLGVTVDERQLTVQHAFSSRSIGLGDIDGYRTGDKDAFLIIPKDGGKSLPLPKGISGRSDLLDWVKEKYEDVDARERAAETETLLEDEQFGASREERETTLKRAKRTAIIANGTGFVLVMWAFLYPTPFETLMIVLCVAPLVGGYFIWHYKGLMRLSSRKSSPYPSTTMLMTFPLFGLGLEVVIRYDLYGFPGSAWMVAVCGAVLLTLIASACFSKALAAEKKKPLAVFCIFLAASAYSFGVLVFSNCFYDRSASQKFAVEVTGKSVSHGKTTTYHLDLSPWGKYSNGDHVQVSSSFYNAVESGDSVWVFLHSGKWGIPWYRVVRPGTLIRPRQP
jgi:hypothetical protein